MVTNEPRVGVNVEAFETFINQPQNHDRSFELIAGEQGGYAVST